jgi:hypothetical protein
VITTEKEQDFLRQLLADLESAGCHPVLLRNYEQFPSEIGNDLDIFVTETNLVQAYGILRHNASANGGVISHVHRRGYFVAIWIDFPESFSPLHIDLYHGALRWHGLPFLDEKAFIERARIHEHGFRTPSPADEALILVLASILWGGFYKSKYDGRIRELLSSEFDRRFFHDCLVSSFGRIGHDLADCIMDGTTAEVVTKSFCHALRRNLTVRCFREKPLGSVARRLCHWRWEAWAYIFHRPGCVVEIPSSVWSEDEIKGFIDQVGSYFGETHISTGGSNISSLFFLQRVRARGKNHLRIEVSCKFALNSAPIRGHDLTTPEAMALLVKKKNRLLAGSIKIRP